MNIKQHAVMAGAALLALAPFQPAAAKQDIVVTKHAPSVAQWSTRVARDLDRRLTSSRISRVSQNREGLVRVNFECSEDGTPAKVKVVRSSGVREFDAAAMKAMESVPTLHPLADGIGHDQRYAAVLVFANSDDSRDRMIRRHLKDTKAYAALPHAKGRTLAMAGPIAPNAR